jgi:hypothetical protein
LHLLLIVPKSQNASFETWYTGTLEAGK